MTNTSHQLRLFAWKQDSQERSVCMYVCTVDSPCQTPDWLTVHVCACVHTTPTLMSDSLSHVNMSGQNPLNLTSISCPISTPCGRLAEVVRCVTPGGTGSLYLCTHTHTHPHTHSLFLSRSNTPTRWHFAGCSHSAGVVCACVSHLCVCVCAA